MIEKKVIKKVVKKEPKIHLEKYFSSRDISDGMRAFLKSRFKIRMYTEKEWDILIGKAIKKRV